MTQCWAGLMNLSPQKLSLAQRDLPHPAGSNGQRFSGLQAEYPHTAACRSDNELQVQLSRTLVTGGAQWNG